MRINKIDSNSFGHHVETKVFYKNPKIFNQVRDSSRIVDKIFLGNGKKVYIDTTTLQGKVFHKVLSLYDESGKFVRSIVKSYKDGKLNKVEPRNWE